MTETGEISSEQSKNNEAESSPDPLPTTPEIAYQGKVVFERIVHKIEDPFTHRFLIEHAFLRQCFVGVRPEIELGSDSKFLDLNADQREQFINGLYSVSDMFHLLDDSFHYENQPAGYALINLAAAEHVIVNNADVFPPEAIEDPRKWVIEKRQEWIRLDDPVRELRYGLLSGFPRWSCEQFDVFNTAHERLNEDLLTPQESELLDTYWDEELDRTPDILEKMDHIFRKSIPNITEPELFAMLHFYPIHSEANDYIGFDKERDVAFAKANDKILQDSGILDV